MVFVTFAAFHALGSPINVGKDVAGRSVVLDGTRMAVPEAEQKVIKRVAELEADRRKAVAAGKPTAPFDSELKERAEDLNTIRALARGDLGEVVKGDTTLSSKSPTIEGMWKKAKENPELTDL